MLFSMLKRWISGYVVWIWGMFICMISSQALQPITDQPESFEEIVERKRRASKKYSGSSGSLKKLEDYDEEEEEGEEIYEEFEEQVIYLDEEVLEFSDEDDKEQVEPQIELIDESEGEDVDNEECVTGFLTVGNLQERPSSGSNIFQSITIDPLEYLKTSSKNDDELERDFNLNDELESGTITNPCDDADEIISRDTKEIPEGSSARIIDKEAKDSYESEDVETRDVDEGDSHNEEEWVGTGRGSGLTRYPGLDDLLGKSDDEPLINIIERSPPQIIEKKSPHVVLPIIQNETESQVDSIVGSEDQHEVNEGFIEEDLWNQLVAHYSSLQSSTEQKQADENSDENMEDKVSDHVLKIEEVNDYEDHSHGNKSSSNRLKPKIEEKSSSDAQIDDDNTADEARDIEDEIADSLDTDDDENQIFIIIEDDEEDVDIYASNRTIRAQEKYTVPEVSFKMPQGYDTSDHSERVVPNEEMPDKLHPIKLDNKEHVYDLEEDVYGQKRGLSMKIECKNSTNEPFDSEKIEPKKDTVKILLNDAIYCSEERETFDDAKDIVNNTALDIYSEDGEVKSCSSDEEDVKLRNVKRIIEGYDANRFSGSSYYSEDEANDNDQHEDIPNSLIKRFEIIDEEPQISDIELKLNEGSINEEEQPSVISDKSGKECSSQSDESSISTSNDICENVINHEPTDNIKYFPHHITLPVVLEEVESSSSEIKISLDGSESSDPLKANDCIIDIYNSNATQSKIESNSESLSSINKRRSLPLLDNASRERQSRSKSPSTNVNKISFGNNQVQLDSKNTLKNINNTEFTDSVMIATTVPDSTQADIKHEEAPFKLNTSNIKLETNSIIAEKLDEHSKRCVSPTKFAESNDFRSESPLHIDDENLVTDDDISKSDKEVTSESLNVSSPLSCSHDTSSSLTTQSDIDRSLEKLLPSKPQNSEENNKGLNNREELSTTSGSSIVTETSESEDLSDNKVINHNHVAIASNTSSESSLSNKNSGRNDKIEIDSNINISITFKKCEPIKVAEELTTDSSLSSDSEIINMRNTNTVPSDNVTEPKVITNQFDTNCKIENDVVEVGEAKDLLKMLPSSQDIKLYESNDKARNESHVNSEILTSNIECCSDDFNKACSELLSENKIHNYSMQVLASSPLQPVDSKPYIKVQDTLENFIAEYKDQSNENLTISKIGVCKLGANMEINKLPILEPKNNNTEPMQDLTNKLDEGITESLDIPLDEKENLDVQPINEAKSDYSNTDINEIIESMASGTSLIDSEKCVQSEDIIEVDNNDLTIEKEKEKYVQSKEILAVDADVPDIEKDEEKGIQSAEIIEVDYDVPTIKKEDEKCVQSKEIFEIDDDVTAMERNVEKWIQSEEIIEVENHVPATKKEERKCVNSEDIIEVDNDVPAIEKEEEKCIRSEEIIAVENHVPAIKKEERKCVNSEDIIEVDNDVPAIEKEKKKCIRSDEIIEVDYDVPTIKKEEEKCVESEEIIEVDDDVVTIEKEEEKFIQSEEIIEIDYDVPTIKKEEEKCVESEEIIEVDDDVPTIEKEEGKCIQSKEIIEVDYDVAASKKEEEKCVESKDIIEVADDVPAIEKEEEKCIQSEEIIKLDYDVATIKKEEEKCVESEEIIEVDDDIPAIEKEEEKCIQSEEIIEVDYEVATSKKEEEKCVESEEIIEEDYEVATSKKEEEKCVESEDIIEVDNDVPAIEKEVEKCIQSEEIIEVDYEVATSKKEEEKCVESEDIIEVDNDVPAIEKEVEKCIQSEEIIEVDYAVPSIKKEEEKCVKNEEIIEVDDDICTIEMDNEKCVQSEEIIGVDSDVPTIEKDEGKCAQYEEIITIDHNIPILEKNEELICNISNETREIPVEKSIIFIDSHTECEQEGNEMSHELMIETSRIESSVNIELKDAELTSGIDLKISDTVKSHTICQPDDSKAYGDIRDSLDHILAECKEQSNENTISSEPISDISESAYVSKEEKENISNLVEHLVNETLTECNNTKNNELFMESTKSESSQGDSAVCVQFENIVEFKEDVATMETDKEVLCSISNDREEIPEEKEEILGESHLESRQGTNELTHELMDETFKTDVKPSDVILEKIEVTEDPINSNKNMDMKFKIDIENAEITSKLNIEASDTIKSYGISQPKESSETFVNSININEHSSDIAETASNIESNNSIIKEVIDNNRLENKAKITHYCSESEDHEVAQSLLSDQFESSAAVSSNLYDLIAESKDNAENSHDIDSNTLGENISPESKICFNESDHIQLESSISEKSFNKHFVDILDVEKDIIEHNETSLMDKEVEDILVAENEGILIPEDTSVEIPDVLTKCVSEDSEMNIREIKEEINDKVLKGVNSFDDSSVELPVSPKEKSFSLEEDIEMDLEKEIAKFILPDVEKIEYGEAERELGVESDVLIGTSTLDKDCQSLDNEFVVHDSVDTIEAKFPLTPRISTEESGNLSKENVKSYVYTDIDEDTSPPIPEKWHAYDNITSDYSSDRLDEGLFISDSGCDLEVDSGVKSFSSKSDDKTLMNCSKDEIDNVDYNLTDYEVVKMGINGNSPIPEIHDNIMSNVSSRFAETFVTESHWDDLSENHYKDILKDFDLMEYDEKSFDDLLAEGEDKYKDDDQLNRNIDDDRVSPDLYKSEMIDLPVMGFEEFESECDTFADNLDDITSKIVLQEHWNEIEGNAEACGEDNLEISDDVKDLLVPVARRKKAKRKSNTFEEIWNLTASSKEHPFVKDNSNESQKVSPYQMESEDDFASALDPNFSKTDSSLIRGSAEKLSEPLLTEQEELELEEIRREQEEFRDAQRKELGRFMSIPDALTKQECEELEEILADEEMNKASSIESEARLAAILAELRTRFEPEDDEMDDDVNLDRYLGLPTSLTADEENLLTGDDDAYGGFGSEEEYRKYVKEKYLEQLEEDRMLVEDDEYDMEGEYYEGDEYDYVYDSGDEEFAADNYLYHGEDEREMKTSVDACSNNASAMTEPQEEQKKPKKFFSLASLRSKSSKGSKSSLDKQNSKDSSKDGSTSEEHKSSSSKRFSLFKSRKV